MVGSRSGGSRVGARLNVSFIAANGSRKRVIGFGHLSPCKGEVGHEAIAAYPDGVCVLVCWKRARPDQFRNGASARRYCHRPDLPKTEPAAFGTEVAYDPEQQC